MCDKVYVRYIVCVSECVGEGGGDVKEAVTVDKLLGMPEAQ